MPATPQTVTGFADVNNTRLYYEVAGEGHPLVLIHGGLVDHHMWDEQFPVFAQHFKVIRYDMRGFGQSGLVKAGDAPYSMRGDLHALLQHLGIEKTYVMGLSMGGGMAIDFTLEYPEMVDALIPVAAGVSGFESEEDFKAEEQLEVEIEAALTNGDKARAVELLLRMWTDGPDRTPEQTDSTVREKVRVMTTRNFNRADDSDAPNPLQLEQPAAVRLGDIQVPTLIIVGDKDVRSILVIADVLEKGIPNAKKAIIPGTAHHLNMEKPQEFNRIVLDFLQTL
jgi:pimeloyl-ACP methyl ester carboxylesterase